MMLEKYVKHINSGSVRAIPEMIKEGRQTPSVCVCGYHAKCWRPRDRKMSMVIQAYNPSYLGGSWFKASPGKNVHKTPFQWMSGNGGRCLSSLASLGIKWDCILNITNTKSVGRIDQVVEYLKNRAWGPKCNPNIEEKKRRKAASAGAGIFSLSPGHHNVTHFCSTIFSRLRGTETSDTLDPNKSLLL
jgi:hypothetical protein